MNNNIKHKLNPRWVTGFTDAEGCFFIGIYKRKQFKKGWKIEPCFQIKLHSRDKDLLLKTKSFFGNIGTIYAKNDLVIYRGLINIIGTNC